jgi:hypothetical protein
MSTSKITFAKAEQVRKSIVKAFAAEEGRYGPTVVADWGHGADYTVVWEEGPHEWTQIFCELNAGYDLNGEVWGVVMKAVKNPVKGVFLEPANGYALSIYPDI